MPDTPRQIFEGPDRYWSPDLAPSRSQLATIAHLSARLLGLPVIATRLDATVTIARLHLACEQHTDAPPRRSTEF